ncbi:MAG: beta-galactosidase [Bacteroidales bacterium]|nr:beta-galactosidase [Bacteroidales bacterium]
MNIRTSFDIICMALLCACSANSGKQEWAPAGDHIRTAWADNINPAKVHQEYPRLQMVRNSYLNLNGLWDYAITPGDADEMPEPEGQILVPFPLESSLSGVAGSLDAEHALWYKRTFKVPANWKKKSVILHFGAVDWGCEVWVNGNKAGEHKGGYGAFEFCISGFLASGTQELVLKVTDATEVGSQQPRGKQTFSESRGSIWYHPVSGIWQTVWAEAVDKSGYIADYQVLSNLADNTITVSPEVCGDGEAVVELLEGGLNYNPEKPGRKVIASAPAVEGEAVLKVENPRLWSPENPYLYGLRIKLVKDGKTIDKVEAYTAMREISIKEDADGHKRMALNGEPLFHYGPLDQGWWPDGLYTAPTDEALRFDIERTKEFGFNMIRKHVKVEPDRWYFHCDQLGILVWQDMPSVQSHPTREAWAQGVDKYDAGDSDQLDEMARANFISEWTEIVNQHKKFPCIVVWVPFNEAWGQFDTEGIVQMTKEIDPTRLVNMASGGNWISGGVGDILDSHHYPNPAMRIWDPAMVNVLGEYGGIGLPVEGHTWVDQRNWGYVKLSTVEETTAKYEEFAKQLLPLVKEGCSAAVYTQTTDVEREVNGLMTYDRKVDKLIPERVAAANREVIESMK